MKKIIKKIFNIKHIAILTSLLLTISLAATLLDQYNFAIMLLLIIAILLLIILIIQEMNLDD